jgi:hypothetical protein
MCAGRGRLSPVSGMGEVSPPLTHSVQDSIDTVQTECPLAPPTRWSGQRGCGVSSWHAFCSLQWVIIAVRLLCCLAV